MSGWMGGQGVRSMLPAECCTINLAADVWPSAVFKKGEGEREKSLKKKIVGSNRQRGSSALRKRPISPTITPYRARDRALIKKAGGKGRARRGKARQQGRGGAAGRARARAAAVVVGRLTGERPCLGKRTCCVWKHCECH